MPCIIDQYKSCTAPVFKILKKIYFKMKENRLRYYTSTLVVYIKFKFN